MADRQTSFSRETNFVAARLFVCFAAEEVGHPIVNKLGKKGDRKAGAQQDSLYTPPFFILFKNGINFFFGYRI